MCVGEICRLWNRGISEQFWHPFSQVIFALALWVMQKSILIFLEISV